MASMAGVMNTFSAQTSMAAAPINGDRTAVNAGKRDAYTVTEPACGRQAKEPTRSASGVEGSSCLPAAGRQVDPSPRLRLGTFNGRRPARESLIGNGAGTPPVSRFLYRPAL